MRRSCAGSRLTYGAISGSSLTTATDWTPREVELAFEVELGSAENAVALRGVIDRVDVDPGDGNRAIVRDYKSGSARPERAGGRWLADHQLQVGLYMLAVSKVLGLDPVAGFYQPLTGRQLRPRGAFESAAPVGRNVYSTDALWPRGAQRSCYPRSRPRRWSWRRSCGRGS